MFKLLSSNWRLLLKYGVSQYIKGGLDNAQYILQWCHVIGGAITDGLQCILHHIGPRYLN